MTTYDNYTRFSSTIPYILFHFTFTSFPGPDAKKHLHRGSLCFPVGMVCLWWCGFHQTDFRVSSSLAEIKSERFFPVVSYPLPLVVVNTCFLCTVFPISAAEACNSFREVIGVLAVSVISPFLAWSLSFWTLLTLLTYVCVDPFQRVAVFFSLGSFWRRILNQK